MKKVYIYKLNLVVEDDIDNLETQNKIDSFINDMSIQFSNIKFEYVSSQLNDLSQNNNFGKCSKCNTWVSDFRANNPVQEFSNGAMIKGQWYCDLCLPHSHENHF